MGFGSCLGLRVVGEVELVGLVLVVFYYYGVLTRGVAIAKRIISIASRPVVNTDMIMGNAAGKAVASFSNGFALSIRGKRALRVSCVKCITRSMGMVNGRPIGIIVTRSARALSRIIIMNASVGGDSLAKTITDIDSGILRRGPIAGMGRTLRNHITNIFVSRPAHPASSTSVGVHNVGAVGKSASPVCIVSNVIVSGSFSKFGTIGLGSITSVRILGSTSTATLCNSHNSGNIIIVAAGGNGGNRNGISCSN